MNKKIVLITGANRGIGLEVAKQLIELNYFVILGMRNVNHDNIQLKSIDSKNSMMISLDVTNFESISTAKKIIEEKFNHLDVLVNNAGIFLDNDTDVLSVDLNVVQKTFETNTFGALRVAQEMTPLLIKSKSARIVNVSSGLGALSTLDSSHPSYNLSKLALNGITKMLAQMLKPHNVLVNSVCPGWTNTDMGKGGRPVHEGAKSVVWAVTLNDNGPTGGYFRDGKKLEW